MKPLLRTALVLLIFALASLAAGSLAPAPLLRRLESWYDRRDGLGEPCSPSTPQLVEGPAGFRFAVPGCWIGRTRFDTRRTEQAWEDASLGVGLLVLSGRRLESEADRRSLERELAARRARPGASFERRPGLGIVRSRRVEAAGERPLVHDEWLVAGDEAALVVEFRAPRILERSSKIAAERRKVESLVATLEPPAAAPRRQ